MVKSNPKEVLSVIDQIDPTLHSPARLMIMAILSAVHRADFTFILKQSGLTRGNLSTHLTKLEDAGYVTITKEFVDKVPRTLICLSDEGKKAIARYRNNMRIVIEELLIG
jgi:DNA-binding MarR family transcriptional regulator